MAAPLVLRLVRPYQTQVEFIAAEGWAIQKDGLVAIGEPELPVGTIVRCEVSLASGLQLIRVEGEVEGYVAARGSRAGGPKLRIRRVTPSSKDFILTVLRARRVSQRPLPSVSLHPGLVTHEGAALSTSASSQSMARVEAASVPVSLVEPRRAMGQRPAKAVECPPNRDALLEQLRERNRNKAPST